MVEGQKDINHHRQFVTSVLDEGASVNRTAIAAVLSLLLQTGSPVSAEERAKPQTPLNDAVDVPYSGTVTEITKSSITVRWPGEEPKKFAVSETLASGGIPKEPRLIPNRKQPYMVQDSFRYRLNDVKVGDHVVLSYAHIGTSDICDHICIVKRPGGRVPPLPDGAVTAKLYPPGFESKFRLSQIPYHERINAHWDLEDYGIPYPEKFGKYRRPASSPRR